MPFLNPETLLIATYREKRAKKDRADREWLIQKLKEKLGDSPDESLSKESA